MRILVAEDERDLNEVIAKKLRAEGHVADSCFDGEEALYYLQHAAYDAAILDIMMPRMEGLEVVRRLRGANDAVPVLLLTARDTVADRVTGLDLGANDYLVKPFAFDELMARLRAITRRAAGAVSNRLRCADLVLDCKSHKVWRGEAALTLSAKEFAVLEYLMRNVGIVVSREQIEAHVWSYEYEGASNVVDVYIRYLRKKIDDGHNTKLIHTVRGSGYVLREDP